MYLNDEAKEMLIDYILEQDNSRKMDNKYAGFEGIVIALVKDGIVHTPHGSGEIKDYLHSYNFIEYVGGEEIITLKIALDRVVSDLGYKKYVNEMITDTQREIKQLMNDANELQNKVGKMSSLVTIQ